MWHGRPARWAASTRGCQNHRVIVVTADACRDRIAQSMNLWTSLSIPRPSFHTGAELLCTESHSADTSLKALWEHSDSIICCSQKVSCVLDHFATSHIFTLPLCAPVVTFANQAGLDMLKTLIALLDILLEKALCSEFAKIMQQGFVYLPDTCREGGDPCRTSRKVV